MEKLYETETMRCPIACEGSGDVHLLGHCEDCDVFRLRHSNLGGVEDAYHNGYVGQDLYEAYCHTFAVMNPHGAMSEWHGVSQFPVVRRMVRKLMRSKGFEVPPAWREDASGI